MSASQYFVDYKLTTRKPIDHKSLVKSSRKQGLDLTAKALIIHIPIHTKYIVRFVGEIS